MILTPTPLQKPALPGATAPTRTPVSDRAAAPVLHSLRAPRQLRLDLQPRAR
jgi:hypothetical protein